MNQGTSINNITSIGFGREPDMIPGIDDVPIDILQKTARNLINEKDAALRQKDRAMDKARFTRSIGHSMSKLTDDIGSAFSKAARKTLGATYNMAANGAKALRAPFLWAAYFTGGPVTAAAHHLFAPEHFEHVWEDIVEIHKTFGYIFGVVAVLATNTALNAYDIMETGNRLDQHIQEVLQTTPCKTGSFEPQIGIQKCVPIHIPAVKYKMPWLLFSSDGHEPYILHRALETKMGPVANENGIEQQAIHHRYGTITEKAFQYSTETGEISLKYNFTDAQVEELISLEQYSTGDGSNDPRGQYVEHKWVRHLTPHS